MQEAGRGFRFLRGWEVPAAKQNSAQPRAQPARSPAGEPGRGEGREGRENQAHAAGSGRTISGRGAGAGAQVSPPTRAAPPRLPPRPGPAPTSRSGTSRRPRARRPPAAPVRFGSGSQPWPGSSQRRRFRARPAPAAGSPPIPLESPAPAGSGRGRATLGARAPLPNSVGWGVLTLLRGHLGGGGGVQAFRPKQPIRKGSCVFKVRIHRNTVTTKLIFLKPPGLHLFRPHVASVLQS